MSCERSLCTSFLQEALQTCCMNGSFKIDKQQGLSVSKYQRQYKLMLETQKAALLNAGAVSGIMLRQHMCHVIVLQC